MQLSRQIEYLLIEQQAMLDLVAKVERAIQQVSHDDFDERTRGLAELRELDHGLLGILDHCNSRDRVIESVPAGPLGADQLRRITSEHERLALAIHNFRFELKFATVDRVGEIQITGAALLSQVRAHLAYEAEILKRIERSLTEPAVARM